MGEVTCCCCIPIKAGVIVLAVLGLLGGISNVYTGASVFVRGFDNDPIAIELRKDPKTADSVDSYITLAKLQAVYTILTGLLGAIMSIILLKGVSDGNESSLRLWVRYSWIMLGISGAILLIIAVALSIAIPKAGILAGISIILFGAIIVGISSYYIMVVNKYADIIEDENRGFGLQPKV